MIIACDETATWYDAISKSTVEEKSCKEVQWVHSFTKDTTCASVGKEIWKQSNRGIRRQKLYESDSHGRLSQLRYWGEGSNVYFT